MTYYIRNDNKAIPTNDRTFATVADALEFARAPRWAGAGPTEITMTGEASYTHMGERFSVVAGQNPRTVSKVTAKPARTHRRYSSYSLTRDMDRADSDN